MNTTHNAVFAVGVTRRLTGTRCTQHEVTDRGQPNTTIRNQLARFVHRRTAQPVPSRRLPLPPNAVASSFRLVPPGPSLDPTLFPPEPLKDQINDHFMYPPQTTIGPPAGNEMTPEQFGAYEEFRHTGSSSAVRVRRGTAT